VDEVVEIGFSYRGAAKKNHEGAIAVGVYVRRGVSKPMDEFAVVVHESKVEMKAGVY